jgi:thioredoxin-related protein
VTRIIILPFCLILFAMPVRAAENAPAPEADHDVPSWFAQSFLELDQELKHANRASKRMLIYFGQAGCPYCRALMQVNFSQQDIVSVTRQHFVPIALDIWGDRELTWFDGRRMTEKQLAESLKVQFTPTILLFDEQGGIVARLNGYYPPHRFRAALDYAAERMERTTDFASYLRANAQSPARGSLMAQPFFAKAPYPIAKGASSLPLVVLFEYNECASCDALHDGGLSNPAVRSELSGFSVVRLNLFGNERISTTDGAIMTEADWARKLGIVYAPTLVFFDVDRREALRMEADFQAAHLLGALRYVASGAHLKEPNFQRFIRDRYRELDKAQKGETAAQ